VERQTNQTADAGGRGTVRKERQTRWLTIVPRERGTLDLSCITLGLVNLYVKSETRMRFIENTYGGGGKTKKGRKQRPGGGGSRVSG